MVFAVVVLDISNTSGRFEWASTMTRNEVPIKGPAKSMVLGHACSVGKANNSSPGSLNLYPYLATTYNCGPVTSS